jgi:hypothetical protein
MSLRPGRALGLDPPERIVLDGPEATIAWARSIPGFGLYAEVFALFLDRGHRLLRAAWMGSGTALEDFAAWPDFALGYSPVAGAASLVLVACRPDEGGDATPADLAVRDLIGVAQAAQDLPLLDVLLVDGARWTSLTVRSSP